jgi:FOG: Ankyrin repeat
MKTTTCTTALSTFALSATLLLAPVFTQAGDFHTVNWKTQSVAESKELYQAKLTAQKAAREGDVQTLQSYLNAGYPQDIVTDRGDTLLNLATYYGHKDAVELLLTQTTTKLDTANTMGFTSLAAAVFKGHDDIAILLMDRGANINGINRTRQTPLMIAAVYNRTRLAQELIARGANVESRDVSGNSAVTLATRQGHTDMIALLNEGLSEKLWQKTPEELAARRQPVSAAPLIPFNAQVAIDQ